MPHCAALLGAGGLSQGQGSVPTSQPYLCQMRPEEGWSEEGRVAKKESREVQPFKRREKYQVTNRSKELKRRVMNLGENHSNHRSLHVRHSQGEKKKKKKGMEMEFQPSNCIFYLLFLVLLTQKKKDKHQKPTPLPLCVCARCWWRAMGSGVWWGWVEVGGLRGLFQPS